MTNVKPEDLNYDHYDMEKYDEDIVRSIPGHRTMHACLEQMLYRLEWKHRPKVLELGVGTGLTAKKVLDVINGSQYTGIDFSESMLIGAKHKLKEHNPELICADYSKIDLPQNNDIVVSVIGMHHQSDEDKKEMFKKIYDSLLPGGKFLFADLVTYRDKEKVAYNDAMHYHHLVENAKDERSLKEWAYHHKFLNKLAPVEDQYDWLEAAGFWKVQGIFNRFNTHLLWASKPAGMRPIDEKSQYWSYYLETELIRVIDGQYYKLF